jgi:hypothetical protein
VYWQENNCLSTLNIAKVIRIQINLIYIYVFRDPVVNLKNNIINSILYSKLQDYITELAQASKQKLNKTTQRCSINARNHTFYSIVHAGQDRTGQDRTGQDRTGQDRHKLVTTMNITEYCNYLVEFKGF